MSVAAEDGAVIVPVKATGLERGIDWTGAFWVASGVPPLVLFSIGAVAATVGKLSWLIWALSISLGFIQSFTYAEIAGLFPNKSGGTSVYGAIAWVRYSKVIAPISVWCNWFAWSPVQATGSALAAGYILTALFAPDAAINTWHVTLFDLGFIRTGLSLRINAVFLLGAVILFAVKAIQDGGILRSANTTKILGISAMIPLILIGVVPILTGDMVQANFFPLVPLAHDAVGHVVNGSWNMAGVTVMAGGMFLAAWSTYGFETAVCYTSELKNPKTDTFKAIFYSGLLCMVVFTLVPFAFQGFLGLGSVVHPAVLDAAGRVTSPPVYNGMLAPDIYSGMGVAAVMGHMVHAGRLIGAVVVVMLVLALVLSLITSMAGSSRTLYQASVDGWLPKYLSRVNQHHAPSNAMLTDLCFNLVLLLMSDSVFVIGAANVGYMIFNFLNLNAGWIHRLDRPTQERPWRAPNWVLFVGACLSFVNLAFMGFGADVYGVGTLSFGLAFCSLIIPVFIFRHYIQDKGHFPADMAEDLGHGTGASEIKRAGIWPFVVVAAGIAVVVITHKLAVY
ncbi:MAG TPA: APC family permease [Steroidobacteraceae bacterium]|nr:APC family permease [Steroidobacteraceae bacterium]